MHFSSRWFAFATNKISKAAVVSMMSRVWLLILTIHGWDIFVYIKKISLNTTHQRLMIVQFKKVID